MTDRHHHTQTLYSLICVAICGSSVPSPLQRSVSASAVNDPPSCCASALSASALNASPFDSAIFSFSWEMAADLANQIRHADNTFGTPAFTASTTKDTTMDAMCRNLEAQIANMAELSLSDATDVSRVIGTTRFVPSMQSRLQQSVLARSVELNAAGRGNTSHNNTQTLMNTLEFFTESHYEKMMVAGNKYNVGVSVVAEVATSLDIWCPSEQTVRNFGALVCAYAWPSTVPSPLDALAVIQSIKSQLRCNRATRDGTKPTVWVYPPTPAGLPLHLRSAAYPDPLYPPVSKSLQRFFLMKSHMVCRTTHKGVRAQHIRPTDGASASSVRPDAISMILNMLGRACAGRAGDRDDEPPLPGLQFLTGGQNNGPRDGQPALADGVQRNQPAALDGGNASGTAVVAVSAPGTGGAGAGAFPVVTGGAGGADGADLLNEMEKAAGGKAMKAKKQQPPMKASPMKAVMKAAMKAAMKPMKVTAMKKKPAAAGAPPNKKSFHEKPACYVAAYKAALAKAGKSGAVRRLQLARAQRAGQDALKKAGGKPHK